jgi:hypothetical protein
VINSGGTQKDITEWAVLSVFFTWAVAMKSWKSIVVQWEKLLQSAHVR